jgi:hypothetical protein
MNITQKVTVVSQKLNGILTYEEIKPEYFVNSGSLAYKQSSLAKQETNDCVVRAFMAALDISYDQAHSWVGEKFNRINRQGTYTTCHIKNVLGTTKAGKKLVAYGCHPSKKNIMEFYGFKVVTNPKYKNKEVGYTLKSFIENHPKGRYFVILKRHAVAVVDGVLYGNSNEQYQALYRSVEWVVKCENVSKS